MSSVPRVAGIVLASGVSQRFGTGNKLLAPVNGTPIVRRTAAAYVEAGLDPVIAVVGYEAQRVKAALTGVGARFVDNPEYGEGQSRGLVRGVQALDAIVEAAVIGVADQPYLSSTTIEALVRAWRLEGAPIVAPRYGGERGNPVLFDRRFFAELLEVTGDQGGRAVVRRHLEDVSYLDVGDPRQGVDVDTVEDLEQLT